LVILRKTLVDHFGVSEQWASLVTFLTATSTLVLPFSIVFNNHIASGALLLLALSSAMGAAKARGGYLAWCTGLCLALAGGVDFNCFLFLPLFLFALWFQTRRGAVFAALAALPVVIVYLSINWLTSGSIVPPALNPPLWKYPGSTFDESNLSGIAQQSNLFDTLVYGFHMLLGNRGLISHSPILIFALWGLGRLWRNRRALNPRLVYGLAMAGCFLFVALCVLRTNNYSGASYGIRWFVTITPMLCLALGTLEDELRRSRFLRVTFSAVALLSILLALLGTIAPFAASPSVVVGALPGDSPNLSIATALEVLDLSTLGRKLHLLVGSVLVLIVAGLQLSKTWKSTAGQAGSSEPSILAS
jgi:hypothetical protein